MGFFTKTMHIPALFAILAIAAEFFGGLGLIVGLLSRVAALGIALNMLVAIARPRREAAGVTAERPVGVFGSFRTAPACRGAMGIAVTPVSRSFPRADP